MKKPNVRAIVNSYESEESSNIKRDPTREEIDRFLNNVWPDATPIERECAVYWLAVNNHSGQGSNLYSVLSTSEYKPGPLEYMPGDSLEEEIYNSLEDWIQ